MPQFNRVVQSLVFWIAAHIGGAITAAVSVYYIDTEYILNTLGSEWVLYEVITASVTVLLSAIIMGLSAYKLWYFRDRNAAPATATGALSSFAALCVSGCPACGITLASYVGLSGILGALPYAGSELRVVGIIGMWAALWYIWRDLEVCKIKKPRTKNYS